MLRTHQITCPPVLSDLSSGMQAYGHDLPACPESGIPEGGALPQPVPEASQSPAAQVSITSQVIPLSLHSDFLQELSFI